MVIPNRTNLSAITNFIKQRHKNSVGFVIDDRINAPMSLRSRLRVLYRDDGPRITHPPGSTTAKKHTLFIQNGRRF